MNKKKNMSKMIFKNVFTCKKSNSLNNKSVIEVQETKMIAMSKLFSVGEEDDEKMKGRLVSGKPSRSSGCSGCAGCG